MDDLGYVLRVLHDADMEAKWKEIGQVLRVRDLNDITADSGLLQVVASWLKRYTRLSDPPSWWRVVWAVADQQGGDSSQSARSIAKKYKGTYM